MAGCRECVCARGRKAPHEPSLPPSVKGKLQTQGTKRSWHRHRRWGQAQVGCVQGKAVCVCMPAGRDNKCVCVAGRVVAKGQAETKGKVCVKGMVQEG